VAGRVKVPVSDLERRIEGLLAHQKELERKLEAAGRQEAAATARGLCARAQMVHGVPLIVESLGATDGETLQAIANELKGLHEGVVVLGGTAGGAVALVATVSARFTSRIQAGKILQRIAPVVGGKGGGRPEHARGGGKQVDQLDRALAEVPALLQ
jgi:alanyl-tRNA synthetase